MTQKIASLYAEISADTSKFKQGLGQVKDGLKQTQSDQKGFFQQAKDGWKAVAAGAAAVGAAVLTAKKTYDFAKEAAEIERVNEKFNRLATGIGTTGETLRADLLSATGGLVSDFEALSSASDFLALGLARNHDEAVRLTRVASELGFDMNQLVLTLTNMTTMRFDALGIQVVGFEEKVKALEQTGLSAADAFQEAFLQQAEQQLERVGSVAGTTLGEFQEFEANIKNIGDALKRDLLDGLEGVISGINDFIAEQKKQDAQFDDLVSNIELTGLSYEQYNQKVLIAATRSGQLSDSHYDLIRSGKIYSANMQQIIANLGIMTESEFELFKTVSLGDLQMAKYLDTMTQVADETENWAESTQDAEEAATQAEQAYQGLWSAASQDWAGVFQAFAEGARFLGTGGLGFETFGTILDEIGTQLAIAGEDAAKDFLPRIEKVTDEGAIAWIKYQQQVNDLSLRDAKDQIQELGLTSEEAWELAKDKTYNWKEELENSSTAIAGILEQLLRLNGTEVSATATIFINTIGGGGVVKDPILDSLKGIGPVDPTQHGGQLSGLNLVGEAGPELIIGDVVIPADLTRKLMLLGLRPGSSLQYGGPLIDGLYTPAQMASLYSPKPPKKLPETQPSGKPGTTGVSGFTTAESLAIQTVESLSGQIDMIQISQISSLDILSTKTAEQFDRSTNKLSSLLEQLIAKTVDLDGMVEANIMGAIKTGL